MDEWEKLATNLAKIKVKSNEIFDLIDNACNLLNKLATKTDQEKQHASSVIQETIDSIKRIQI